MVQTICRYHVPQTTKNFKSSLLNGNMKMSITVILSEHHLQDKNNLIKIHSSISDIKSEAIKNLSKKFLKNIKQYINS